MSQTLSPSLARCYGMARVARVWKISRASVYRSLKETPPNTIARRPGPVGACSDAELAEHIRQHIAASRLHGEGYRKLWARLRFAGVRASPRRVRRVMRENGEPSSGLALAIQLLLSFARTYLWPLGLALLAWAVFAGFRSTSEHYGFGRQIEAFLVGALGGILDRILVVAARSFDRGQPWLCNLLPGGGARCGRSARARPCDQCGDVRAREPLCAKSHDLGNSTQAGLAARLCVAAYILGDRRIGNSRLSPGFSRRHWHNPLRAVGDGAAQSRPSATDGERWRAGQRVE